MGLGGHYGKQSEKMMGKRSGEIYVLGVVLIFCFLSPSVSYGDQEIKHLISITRSEEFGTLGLLGGVFFDESKERFYVTDASHNRILSFDSNFKFLSEFTGGDALTWPTGLVRDSRGRFFVAQPTEGSVVLIDISKRDIQPIDFGSIPSENPIYPCNLAVGPFDDLYVVDKANERILIFDVNQKFSGEITVEGARGLKDVKVDSSGRVYAVSTIDGSVHIYDAKGARVFRFGRKADEKGAFRFPVSLAVDRKGLIYVLDQHMSKVLVFNRRGEFLFDFSRLGWREGRLHYPSYIFINRSGRIFIIDRQNSRVSIFE